MSWPEVQGSFTWGPLFMSAGFEPRLWRVRGAELGKAKWGLYAGARLAGFGFVWQWKP